MSVFDPEKFARFLQEVYARSPYKSQASLAKAAGLQRSTVNSYFNARKQSITGKESRPTVESVIALARALDHDVDEFLLMAGHAPTGRQRTIRPKNVAEFVNRLEEMGFDMQISGDLSLLGPDDLNDLLVDIQAKLLYKTSQVDKGRIS